MSVKFRKHSRLVWAFVVLYLLIIAVNLVRNLLDPGAEFAPIRWLTIAMGIFILARWMPFKGLELRRTPADNG